MLHALELENFKAFGERVRIPFAPITLIFGENSAGKSTILQALNLLKQTRESREADVPLLLRGGNEIVDLGSFQELLFDHDLKRALSVRVEAAVDRRNPFRSSYKKNKIAIEFSFKRSPTQREVLLEQIGIYGMGSSECIAKFQPLGPLEKSSEFSRRVGSYGNRFLHTSRSFSSSKITSLKCVDLTKETEYWEQEFKWCKNNEGQIRSRLEERKAHLERSLERQVDEEMEGDEQEYSNEESDRLQRNIDLLSADLKFFLSNFDLESYISKRQQEEMDTVMDVQGFLPIQARSRERSTIITRARSLLNQQSALLNQQSDDIVFNVREFAMLAGRALERVLEVLFPMGPFRRPPERWYIFRGTTPQDVGYRGNLLPDLLFRNSKLVEETNEWLKQLDIGYELTVKPIGTDSGDLFEVRLIDTRRKEKINEDNVNVALPDVGFGISQLLPFVVQSLVSKGQIISIEQPEVHVHPRLQADLGDLLVEAIKPKRGNQFIIETHSEHLVLRLQRRVYEKKIKPEDVSVIYISRGPEGAEARRLHLDEEGDFIDEWPDGFFPERLRELR